MFLNASKYFHVLPNESILNKRVFHSILPILPILFPPKPPSLQLTSAGCAKRKQSARPLGQGVLDHALHTLAMPQGHAKRPFRPQTGFAHPVEGPGSPKKSSPKSAQILHRFLTVPKGQKLLTWLQFHVLCAYHRAAGGVKRIAG